MRLFSYENLARSKWDSEMINLLSQIHEHKGKQEVFLTRKPAVLDKLVEIAKIQSVEDSNKIEGIVTTAVRIKELMNQKTTPRNRDKEEILGYRDVLNTIHESYEYIPISSNYILQLHRELFKYSEKGIGGRYKNTQNSIVEKDKEGNAVESFKPLSPYETPGAIEQICDELNIALEKSGIGWHENKEDPLPFIKYILRTILAAYIDFEERGDYVDEKVPTIELVRNAIDRKLGKFTKSDMMELVPSVGKATIENMLKQLTEEEYIERHGKGRATFYVKK